MFTTHYFETRTLARNNVAVLNGKFKDFGTDAPKGERWAVLVEVEQVQSQSIETEVTEANHEVHLNSLLHDATITPPAQHAGILQYNDLKTPNNRPVRFMKRRSQLAIRLAKSLDKTA